MKIGFTGTQAGMTEAQANRLAMAFNHFCKDADAEFHHGDCIGADARAHELFRIHGHGTVVLHPPDIQGKRAFCNADTSMSCQPYLDRNRAMVDACEVLLATPKSDTEELRSGTWSTIRYALSKHKQVFIIFPDGNAARG